MSAIQTFKTLQDQVMYWLDEAGTTGTTLENVKHAINMAHQHRLAQQPWNFLLWDTAETLSIVSGTRVYALHEEYWRPFYFYSTTNRRFLREVPGRQLAEVSMDWNNDASGHGFKYGARVCVHAQPAAASVLTIVSTSAADTEATKAVTVRGVTPYGVTSETITPTGVTPASGTVQFTKVLSVTKGAAWTGMLTLSAGATTLLYLYPGEFGRSYQTLELLWTPSASESVEYRFYRQPTVLVNDNDVPDIPPPHAQILVPDALLMFSATNTDVRAEVVRTWEKMQSALEVDLLQTQMDGQSIAAFPQTVLSGSDDDASYTPRINY